MKYVLNGVVIEPIVSLSMVIIHFGFDFLLLLDDVNCDGFNRIVVITLNGIGN